MKQGEISCEMKVYLSSDTFSTDSASLLVMMDLICMSIACSKDKNVNLP